MAKSSKTKFLKDKKAREKELTTELLHAGAHQVTAVGAGYLINTTFKDKLLANPQVAKWLGPGLQVLDVAAQVMVKDPIARHAAAGLGAYGAIHSASTFIKPDKASFVPAGSNGVAGLGAADDTVVTDWQDLADRAISGTDDYDAYDAYAGTAGIGEVAGSGEPSYQEDPDFAQNLI